MSKNNHRKLWKQLFIHGHTYTWETDDPTGASIPWLQPQICIGVNSLRPRQNGRHFADDIFKCIFLNENVWIPIKISLKFVPKGPIDNIPALVQIMAWRRPGDKPLSEPMMVSLPTHICVARPQWVKALMNGYIPYETVEVHDDVIKWKHFPRNWSFVQGIHRSRWIPHTKASGRSFDVFFHLRLNKRLSKQP